MMPFKLNWYFLISLVVILNYGCAIKNESANDFIGYKEINKSIPTGSQVKRNVTLNGFELPMSDESWVLVQSFILKPKPSSAGYSNGMIGGVFLGQYNDSFQMIKLLSANTSIDKNEIKILPKDQCIFENSIWLSIGHEDNKMRCAVGFVQQVPMGGYSAPFLTVRVIVAEIGEKLYQFDLGVNLTALGYVRFDVSDWSFKTVQRDFLKREVVHRLQIWSAKLLEGASAATSMGTEQPFGTLPSLWDEMLAAHKAVYP